jgi:hypothetical protein
MSISMYGLGSVPFSRHSATVAPIHHALGARQPMARWRSQRHERTEGKVQSAERRVQSAECRGRNTSQSEVQN